MADDKFEESEMHDGAPILRRDKVVARKMAGLFFASGLFPMLASLLIAFGNGNSAKPMSPEGAAVVIGLSALMGVGMWIGGIVFGVLRTLVTKKAVHVKYGFWGPTIPLEAIQSARVIEYDWTEFGGWGMKISPKGSAYVPQGGPVVELVYLEDGAKKRVVVGAENAAATVSAINDARSAHVRVATDEADEREEVASEEEAEQLEKRA